MNAMLPGSFKKFAEAMGIDIFSELIVDSFAGGGGASTGIRRALERMRALGLLDEGDATEVNIAINHNDSAIAMHRANHPTTFHMPADIWSIDPRTATDGRPVGAMWASPDCRVFSRARAGQPVDGKIRGLAWVVAHWAEQVRPRIIFLENVEEFLDWGPLITRADGKTIPDRARKGETFREWARKFEMLGYRVEWRKLHACDYGAPTIRKRLYVIMRMDDKPIVWPQPTHGSMDNPEVLSGALRPYRTAFDVVDFDRVTPTIFMSAEESKDFKRSTGIQVRRPLAYNTQRRIAIGVARYVLNALDPFIVLCNHSGEGFRGHGLHEPMKTVTAARDAYGLVVPFVAMNRNSGNPAAAGTEPVNTIAASGAFPALGTAKVAPFMLSLKGSDRRDASILDPLATITAQGQHSALVAPHLALQPLTDEQLVMAKAVATFLREHGVWNGGDIVTVGDYVIYDIGLRMLTTRELARAQGFDEDYILDAELDGRVLTDEEQRHKVGNSVCPDVAAALIFANFRPERRGGFEPEEDWPLEKAA